MRNFKRFSSLIVIATLLAGCTSFAPFAATLTPTITLTPTPSSTPTPVPPSIPHGLRTENAATQTYENGTWVVRNADGKTTATWNEETKTWVFSPENIYVEQVLIGNNVDRSLIEPYLGLLPPDDPETHFIDPTTGKRVEYGIGPEFQLRVRTATQPNLLLPATAVFVRYRGAAPLIDENLREPSSVFIFEIPKSPDLSIILCKTYPNSGFSLVILSGDVADLDFTNAVYDKSLYSETGLQRAQEHLIGSMILLVIEHDVAEKIPEDYQFYSEIDGRARILLDYITGTSTQIPIFDLYEGNIGISPSMYFPENQVPPQE